MPLPRPLVVLVAAATCASALAGCVRDSPPPAADAEGYSVARTQTLEIDGELLRALMMGDADAEDVRDAVRATLVVRVAEPGDYVLTYTDSGGREREERLDGMQPGRAREVAGVDPLTTATLERGGETVFERGIVRDGWWTVVGFPLGVALSEGASAAYLHEGSIVSEVSLEDVQLPGETGYLDRASFSLDLPTRGHLSWAVHPDGDEQRIEVRVDEAFAAPGGPYFEMEVAGLIEGKSGSVGARLPRLDAGSEGGATLWVLDGRLTGARFDGASARASVDLDAWATGEFVEDAMAQCPDGATPEAPCRIPDVPSYDKSRPGGGRVPIPEAEDELPMPGFFAEIERGLAGDLVVGDSYLLRMSYEDEGALFSSTFEMAVAARERVEVPAGAFDAFKVVQSARMVVRVDELAPGGETLLEDLDLDETVWRSTSWLEASTYQPLQVVTESPVDVDEFVHEVVGSVGDAVWEQAGIAPVLDHQYRWTATSTTRVVAERVSGETRFAPGVGLALATLMGNGGFPLAGLGMLGVVEMGDPGSAFSGGVREGASRFLSLSSAGPVVDDRKAYLVEGVSPGLRWSDLALEVNGEPLHQQDAALGCVPLRGAFAACSHGVARSDGDEVRRDDLLHVGGVREGDVLRVLVDGGVIAVLVVA